MQIRIAITLPYHHEDSFDLISLLQKCENADDTKQNKRRQEFWLSVQNTYPTLSTAALKVLLSFTTSYMCEIGFSAMIGIKTKL
ncbi:SCAN domain-containing protein 3 [Trichinella britovi]|uniref:SCAN domain-containing protein 3 n=1 Tax=Trichinella britovi TaxID=45882 RepID=A0A0V1C693_TRIBR|nr:SCAN domain-containing protein 3 [Trichinella britovi]